jgi:Uma2 family endonuclease
MTATAPVIRTAKLSRARYDAMIAAGILTENDALELLDGKLYEAMPKGPLHSATINRINQALLPRLLSRAIVSVQNSIALHEYSEPEPDITVLRYRDDFYAGVLAEPKDILFLVEVSDSTLAYDRDLKIPLYAAANVAEVWLADLQARTVTVYREPKGNEYGQQIVYSGGDGIPLPEFPGERVAVSDLGL